MAEICACPGCGGITINIPEAIGMYPTVCTICGKEIEIEVTQDANGTRQVNIREVKDWDGLLYSGGALVFIMPFMLLAHGAIGTMEITLFFIGLFVIFLLVIFGKGYNKLALGLNKVSTQKSEVEVTLSRRGISINDLQNIAESAGGHEEKTQVGVAVGRGQKASNPFILGSFSVETPPDLKAIKAFTNVQEKLGAFEQEFLSKWEQWASAAREYEDSRSTFPLIFVALICNAIKSGRFPSVFKTQAENDYNPRHS